MSEGLQTIGRGRWLELLSRNGWEFVRRTNSTGIVVIIALTDDDELLLVEQYRAALDARAIELPAGLMGDIPGEENEAAAIAAERELIEETGYRPRKLEFLYVAPDSAGSSSETLTLFRASQLERVGDGGGDEHEDITVHRVPLRQLNDWILAQAALGKMVDLKIYSALAFARPDSDGTR